MYRKFGKRLFDIVFSFFGLLFLSPTILVMALLVRIKLGAPVIFCQERPGLKGRIFKLYKFRSMSNQKDKNGQLLPDIERLTSFGKVLRAASLDELPALLNVLKGDVSLVGPRPLLVKYLPYYTAEESRRHNVRPGITGLAQINGRNILNWDTRLALDTQYIDELSFMLDAKIIAQTALKVLRRDGVVVRDDNPMQDLNIERGEQMKCIARLMADDCLKYRDDIEVLLQEVYAINLPASNMSMDRCGQMAAELVDYLNNDSAVLFGAFENGDFAGFLWAYPRNIGSERRLHLNHIILKSQYRKKSFGNALLRELENYAVNNEFAGIELLCTISNIDAMRFYERDGFVAERTQFFKKVEH